MEAEAQSPWFLLERARRRHRVEAAQNGRAETEKRWIEDAAEKRRKDAIKREEVEKWANEDISRKWNETIRKRIKKKESMVQIQDNWNFMLSQQEYRLNNQDETFGTAGNNDNSKPLEENYIRDKPKKNIDLMSRIMEEESSKSYAGGSKFYKVDLIENKPKNIVQDINGPSSHKSDNFEKSCEDDNYRKLAHYEFNSKNGMCASKHREIFTAAQHQKDTNIELHIIQTPINDTQDNNTKINAHRNKNSMKLSSMQEPLKSSENPHDKNQTKLAIKSHEECLIGKSKSTIDSDEVEIFV